VGDDHPQTLKFGNNLAMCLTKQGRLDEAEPIYRAIVASVAASPSRDPLDAALYRGNLGECLSKSGKCEEAEPLLLECLAAVQKRHKSDEHPEVQNRIRQLASLYERCGRPDEAKPFRARLLVATSQMSEPGK